jgi:hypothetical protein
MKAKDRMTTIQCTKCGRAFDSQKSRDRVASISGSIAGDEYTDTYYYCNHCGIYTVEVYHEPFLAEEGASLQKPLPKAEGDAMVALICQCPEPWDKKCHCQAHLAYFGDSLD